MTAVKHEDAVMKMGFDYFRDTILKMLNIHYQFVDSRPTELIEIDIENLHMDCGINTYRVHSIYLTGLQADKILKNVKSKIESGFTLNEEDFANLTLTPLMASTMSRKDIIKEAIQIVRQEKQPTAEKTMAMLYTLADKFLNTDELEEIKEVLTVTRLGQMIYDDGIKKGIEQGIEQGISEKIAERVWIRPVGKGQY